MIKRYGLLIGLLMVCASAFAMEPDEEPPAAAPVADAEQEMTLKDMLLWPFRPFEIVDRNDAVRRKYKNEILADWPNLSKKPEDYDAFDEERKELSDYPANKLQNIKVGEGDDSVLPTRNQILIWKYGTRCKYTRWIPRFLHGSPYSYVASGLYYCALAAGAVKGAQKIRKILRDRKDSTSLKSGEEVKHATTHSDCAWCRARQKEMNVRNHTVEESI